MRDHDAVVDRGGDDPLRSLRTGAVQASEWPKDLLTRGSGAELAAVDVAFLNAIDEPERRQAGAAAIAAIALTQSAYREALIANHRSIAEEVAGHARFVVKTEGRERSVLFFSDDPIAAMERFAHEARHVVIQSLPAGASISLTDSAGQLDAARTSEGKGTSREQFGTQVGRALFASIASARAGDGSDQLSIGELRRARREVDCARRDLPFELRELLPGELPFLELTFRTGLRGPDGALHLAAVLDGLHQIASRDCYGLTFSAAESGEPYQRLVRVEHHSASAVGDCEVAMKAYLSEQGAEVVSEFGVGYVQVQDDEPQAEQPSP